MRRTRTVAAAGLLLALSAGCTTSTPAPTHAAATPAAVALAATGVPAQVKIGVVVSLTTTPGQGGDWVKAAEGAQVAAYRYRLGGTEVELEAVDDQGTPEGATEAVNNLIGQGVAGVVLASEGSHLQPAITAAAGSGTPLLLPYQTDPSSLTGNAWLTGPTAASIGAALTRAVSDAGVTDVLVLDAGGDTPDGFAPYRSEVINPQQDTGEIAKTLRGLLKDTTHDGLLITGSAAQQAAVVRAVQSASLPVPVLLGPAATSPAFASALAADGGSLAGSFTTVGTNSADAPALQPGPEGAAMSAFLAAVRATAADPAVTDFFDGQPYATVAPLADSRSHDAVVTLVTAAAKAGSSKPADVAKALSGLTLGAADGLAGPSLAFTGLEALNADAVVPLVATTTDSGLRPQSGNPTLNWFRAPTN